MSSYRTPQFLTDRDEPTSRVRCPIHGFIRFSENERRIIDHRLFRRLRYIRQLALTELVYPGATHTRFEHSLGVMEVATRARLAGWAIELQEWTDCTHLRSASILKISPGEKKSRSLAVLRPFCRGDAGK